MSFCYILHSDKLNKFYTGFTSGKVEDRLFKHNSKFYGKTFTSAVDDWKIFLIIQCSSNTQALKIEKHIKEMKSKVYINNLKKYPEIIDKLLSKYQDN